ncbi:hypothetical protein B9Z55_015314 [Caenorhabditis nigoni]|uniref:DUF7869 domain-containing protein n=4 Tax=Caenorhabditis nigoni TaxID=1611254 RepID=A0A2G5U9P6_9PELO|nr:hypothetical protein B9Z55_015314 [Caenorhabditis nigoni]
MPSKSHPTKDIMHIDCCEKNCMVYLRRIDVLMARHNYVSFYEKLDKPSKADARYIFISCLYRRCNNTFKLIPIVEDNYACPNLIGLVFGFSVNQLMNGLADDNIKRYQNRPWYSSTVHQLSTTIVTLSRHIQHNSIGRLMLPPNFNARMASECSSVVPVSVVSKQMNLQIQLRKSDSLTRCISCCSLHIIMNDKTKSPEDRKHAENMWKLHLKTISQQRTIVESLCKQSRDKEFDITVILMDEMSNKHSKLPLLVNRPKSISDGDRIGLDLTTVQVAKNQGTHKYINLEYPIIQGITGHDSSYSVSLIMDALTKLDAIPSTIYLILDSCGSNKSFLVFGALGFILSKVPMLEQFILLYPSTGHTHNSCDGHFGVLSKSSMKKDIYDPEEYVQFLESLPSVTQVEKSPTIYEFENLREYIHKPAGLCSNGQIIIARASDGDIHYSSSSTMNASVLFGVEDNRISSRLFTSEFYTSSFSPTIRSAESSQVKLKLESLMRSGKGMLKNENHKRFIDYLDNMGRKAIRRTLSTINSKPAKVTIRADTSDNDPTLTVLKYLESCGVNAGRIPKRPRP